MSKEPNRNVYVGHRYVPKIMGEWDNKQDYEGLSIVTNKGTSYTSKKRVPVGIDILNEEFWVVTGNYNAQVEEYRSDVRNIDEKLSSEMVTVKENVNNGLKDVNKRNGIYSKNNKKATMVILDDDTRKQSYDVLYNFAKSYNVKINLAVISGKILENNPNHISYDEFLEMNDDPLVEYVNHTHTHPRLYGLSDIELENEIKQCQDFLTSHGVHTKHFVYPYGEVDDRIKNIVSKYSLSASKSNGLAIRPDNKIIDMYQLDRIVFEEELSTFQNRINNISEHGGCIIINSHSNFETFNTKKLSDIVNMARDKGVEIVHLSEAIDNFKNAIEIRDGENELVGGVSSTGYTSGIFNSSVTFKNYESYKNDDPPETYEMQKITISLISSTLANENNLPSSGQMHTHRFSNDDFTFQEIQPFRSSKTYKRYWNTTSESWSEWFTIKTSEDDSPFSQTFSNISIDAGQWTNLRVENDKFKVGDTIAYSYDTPLPNLVTLSPCLIATNGSVMFRLINLSDVDTYNIEDITFYVKKV